jgi:hypothetical protein
VQFQNETRDGIAHEATFDGRDTFKGKDTLNDRGESD